LLEPDALENTKLKRGNATNELQARISGAKGMLQIFTSNA
jgi:hypothetical protein